jgi:hypothetical protein
MNLLLPLRVLFFCCFIIIILHFNIIKYMFIYLHVYLYIYLCILFCCLSLQAVTGAVTHHLAYQAQGLLQSMGLAGSSGSSEKKSTPLENLSRNAQAELLNRLHEALAVYRV